MSTPSQPVGSAAIQSDLWGAQPENWSQLQEKTVLALYQAVLKKLSPLQGTRLLDVGCGSGLFASMAASNGAEVSGFDATAPLLEIAKQRTPRGNFRLGDMEQLPYADHTFAVVTGFNSFQYAADPLRALAEARRVAKPGGKVVMATWGKPENCESVASLKALGALLPPPPPGTPGPFALSAEGALEALVAQVGLNPVDAEYVTCVWEYPDDETALRGLLCAGPAIRAIRQAGIERARQVVLAAIASFKTDTGGYRMNNQFRYLIATA